MRNSARTSIVVLASTLVSVAVAAGVSWLINPTPAQAITSPLTDLHLALQVSPDAEVVYFQQCSPCHGVAGEGGIGPSLNTSTLSAEARLQLIRSGLNAMPAFAATLDEATINAISRLAGRLAATTTYAQQCAPCHGSSGEGGIGPAVDSGAQTFEDIRLVISEGEGAMPAFRPTLTDDQLDGVTSHVQSLALTKAGSELYAQQCTACHGAAGEGGVGPALAGSDIGAEDITSAVSAGVGSMPGFSSSLSAPELSAVLSYTRSLVAGLVAPQAPTNTAATVYSQLCASCHGVDGEGGAGPALTGGVDEELTTVISEGAGAMPGFASDLTAEEISGLVAFLQSSFGQPSTPREGGELYAELCAACHGVDGEGGVGPPLGGLGPADDALTTLINEGKGSMPGFAAQLDGEGVVRLIEYLVASFGAETTTTTVTVPLRSGAAMYAAECARCHLADGSGDEGPDLRDTALSLNEIISRIYGGHSGGMPAFDGELTGLEVQELARFVTTLRKPAGEDEAAWPVLWTLLLSALVVLGVAGFVFARRPRGSEMASPRDRWRGILRR